MQERHQGRVSTRSGRLLGMAILWAVASGLALSAAEIKFIANPSVKVSNLSTEELKQVFLIKTNSLRDGSRVEPVIGRGSPAYEIFLKQYLGKNDSALTTYYLSLVFTGKALMPKLLTSDAEVIAYVTKTKGTVGYVVASASTPGLRAVTIK